MTKRDTGPGKELRYLWVYSAADDWTLNWHERNRKKRLEHGYDVRYFCNTPASLNRRWLPFYELDRMWKRGDTHLMALYENLARELENRDVLVLYNGANLHPDFVSSIKNVVKVYTCGDPESSAILSEPLSPYFDIHLVNQSNELERFRNRGLKRVYFWPLGSLTMEEDVEILNEVNLRDLSMRPLPAFVFCGYTPWRKEKLDRLKASFPDAFFAGPGWDSGYVSWEKMWAIHRTAQIGWNIHNTTGFNFRTYDLLAYGAMQVCDNKADLGVILADGKEVVGYNSIDECIEQTRYYLDHPKEQREIAVAGWKRWKQEYSPDRVWEKLVSIVEENWPDFQPERPISLEDIRVSVSVVNRRKIWGLPYRMFFIIMSLFPSGVRRILRSLVKHGDIHETV